MSGVARRRPTHAITATNHGTTTDPNSHRPGHVQLDRPNGARSETGGVAGTRHQLPGPDQPRYGKEPGRPGHGSSMRVDVHAWSVLSTHVPPSGLVRSG